MVLVPRPQAETARDDAQRMLAEEPVLAGEFDSRPFRRLEALRLRTALAENVPRHAVLRKFSLMETAVNEPRTPARCRARCAHLAVVLTLP